MISINNNQLLTLTIAYTFVYCLSHYSNRFIANFVDYLFSSDTHNREHKFKSETQFFGKQLWYYTDRGLVIIIIIKKLHDVPQLLRLSFSLFDVDCDVLLGLALFKTEI